jgi:cyclophilin family peptidyl-prolyl cis-trans isomerase/HEAT repeat protein
MLAACGPTRSAPDAGGAPPSTLAASGTPSAAAATDRLAAILGAEHRRLASAVTPADQQSRDPAVRRAAARALARIGGGSARPGLLRALDDEDAEVVTWASYGLGFSCKGHEKETVAALVARALAWPGLASPQRAAPPADDGGAAVVGLALDRSPAQTIARAIGRCGSEDAEPTLVAWLGAAELAVPAALALGDVASAKQKLREETLAALLNLAAGSAAAPPVPEALFAVGRLEHVPLNVVDRILEVATARLSAPGESRLFAVRALGRAGEAAAAELGRVLRTAGSFTPGERAEAARGLARLGKLGQRALADALVTLVPTADPVALTALVSDDFGVLLTALEQISDASVAKKPLADLAALPPPPDAPPQILRRVSQLRCTAAKTLVGVAFQDKLLTACDVSASGLGGRAQVEVIGRADIMGPRLVTYRERAHDADVRTREAAIELLEKHDEVEGTATLLADALGAKEGGVVATAATVLSKQPQRAIELRAAGKPLRRKGKKKVDLELGPSAAPAPAPALVKALLDALARPQLDADPEIAEAIVDAAGALALQEARPRLDELCRSPYPTTREHAAKALGLLGGDKKTCEPQAEGGPPPAELDHLVQAPVALELDTDAGRLTLVLDPTLAPIAVTRVTDLARSGYYDGILVHRVVPGFVAQLGAPSGDGFGGPEGKPALRCETSPVAFAPFTVGVALAGRDTGSSQIFVMQGRYPHLDGLYAAIGTAAGPWGALAEGDIVRKVTVAP